MDGKIGRPAASLEVHPLGRSLLVFRSKMDAWAHCQPAGLFHLVELVEHAVERIDDNGVAVAVFVEFVALHVVECDVGGSSRGGSRPASLRSARCRARVRAFVGFVGIGDDLHIHAFLVRRHEDEAHVGVAAERFADTDGGDEVPRFGCSGQSVMSWFHGLSGGKTSSAVQIASASGVLNSTGLVTGGSLAARSRFNRAGSLAAVHTTAVKTPTTKH